MRMNYEKLTEDYSMITKSNYYKYAFRIVTICSVLFLTLGLGAAHAQLRADQPHTLDDLFATVAIQVPEFGGMIFSENEEILLVYLTDPRPRKLAAVRSAIEIVFGYGVIPKGGVKAIPGQYGFLQFKEWYDRMLSPVWSIPGVTFTDINEAKNRLGIGIENREVEAQVVEQLERLGIPREVVIIQVTGPIEPVSHTLQSTVSPREGGYQLHIPSGGTCTLGFNATTQNNVAGFVTNSHCTTLPWSVDGGIFYQAVSPNTVGQEIDDPPGFTGSPCLSGYTCRYSDSAFVKYNAGVAWNLGSIARTTGISLATPNLTVDHGLYNIQSMLQGFNGSPGRWGIKFGPSKPYLINLTLNKVGRTTGWGKGAISQTCVIYGWTPKPNSLMLCQYDVTNTTSGSGGIAAGGDSGSPVFRINDPNWKNVELYGIVWARHNANVLVFSPIGNSPFQQSGIQTELGTLNYINPCLPPFVSC